MNSKKLLHIVLLLGLTASATALGSEQPNAKIKDKKPEFHERGWIGGQYKLARQRWSWFGSAETVVAFPKSLTNTQNAGILITSLTTNTPAYLAGLREADLILELDHQKIRNLADFHHKIDSMKGGNSLAVHVYRGGVLQDYKVTVGRETFRNQGAFGFALPFGLPEANFRFNPSFSLIALGFSRDEDHRAELGSPEQMLLRETFKEHHPSDPFWRAWVGPIFVWHSREIFSQDVLAPAS